MAAAIKTVISQLLRIKIGQALTTHNLHTASLPLCFNATNVLWAEPPKKKGRINPNMTAAKVEKKKKRLEKELRKMGKHQQRYKKPVEELEILPQLKRDIQSGLRRREKTVYASEELEEHVLLEKDWTRYKMKQHRTELRAINRVTAAQERALSKLREESEELYQQAIQIDEGLMKFTVKGPLQNPPLEGYDPADGNYTDITNYFKEEIL